MKATKEYLKELIREQIKEQEDITAAADDVFDKAVAKATGKPLDQAEKEVDMDSQELKKKILDMATNVSGIMKNELDIVNFALSILDAAKNKNLNSGILRQKLELVRDELARIKS